jgi:hypothetical protein
MLVLKKSRERGKRNAGKAAGPGAAAPAMIASGQVPVAAGMRDDNAAHDRLQAPKWAAGWITRGTLFPPLDNETVRRLETEVRP